MCRACLKAPQRPSARSHAGSFWREVPFVLSHATASRRAAEPGAARPTAASTWSTATATSWSSSTTRPTRTSPRTPPSSTRSKHHAGQAEVYAQALSAATGLQVREVVFVYCKAGAEVRLRERAVVGVAVVA